MAATSGEFGRANPNEPEEGSVINNLAFWVRPYERRLRSDFPTAA